MMGHSVSAGNLAYDFYEVQLDLSGLRNAAMQFDFITDTETFYDGMNVLASTGSIDTEVGLQQPSGGQAYTHTNCELAPAAGGGSQNVHDCWSYSLNESAIFDLSTFNNQIVNVRVQFASDESIDGSAVNIDNIVVNARSVPEPATLALMGLGLAGIGYRRRQLMKA